ncbi:C-type lectin domain family 10 member A-like [Mytilus galloprovincialis]|uniref:C-type lectin domain family 10 member A-like n=1 Tax=Mytilus galloprovincialis TaxID=29158 RepID=UPI003F7C572E
MNIGLLMVFSFLLYSCNGSLVDQNTQSYTVAAVDGKDITNIKTEFDVMKGNYHALLMRVVNNEHEIAFLKGQTQQLEHTLENTKRTFSCEIEGLRDGTIQLEQELKETTNAWKTINDTIQDLSPMVNVLDSKYSPLEIPGKQSNESGDGSECPLDWVRRVDFGACYFVSYSQKSWNDAQEQCRRHNGSLTDINSENEAVFLAEYSRNHKARSVWIGGKNDHGVYKWFTSDGKTKHMNYTRWTNTQTQYNTRNRSLCAQLYDDVEYKWLKWNCDVAENFICKTYI